LGSRVSSERLRCVEQKAIAWCARLAAGSPGATKREYRGRSRWVAGRTAALLLRLDKQCWSGCRTSTTATVCPSSFLIVTRIAGQELFNRLHHSAAIFTTHQTPQSLAHEPAIHQRKEAPLALRSAGHPRTNTNRHPYHPHAFATCSSIRAAHKSKPATRLAAKTAVVTRCRRILSRHGSVPWYG